MNKLNNLYIFFFNLVLLINVIFTTPLNANSFKISDLEIFEPFELNFNKEKVIDRAFSQAFTELYSKITTSGDNQKLKNTPLKEIKTLIDSFTIDNEKFINNEYHVEFDVNFNKENTLNFFEKKNIFPSIPQDKKILFIPIIVDLQDNETSLFSNNIFYERWNENIERYFLLDYLLPTEDIEEVKFIINNSESIETYDFSKTILKYDLNHYIISIFYKNENKLSVLSKIKLDKTIKVNNKKFINKDLSRKSDLNFIISELKVLYEDYWKNINQINTSIKLPLTISIKTKEYEKVEVLEKVLDQIDLVSNFEILRLNSEDIFYKVIYNGSPNKFINDMMENGIELNKQNQVWVIE